MISRQITKFEWVLLAVFFFELFAGGGGRLLAVGPISIRQIFFILVLLVFCVRFFINKKTRDEILNLFRNHNTGIFWLSLLMILWILCSTIIGIFNGHSVGMVLTDTFRVIFVVMIIPLFYYIGENRFDLKSFLNVLFLATFIVSLVTILIGLSGKFMTDQQFYYFYKNINKIFPGDLFFRPSRGLFYKSHFLVLFSLLIFSVEAMESRISLMHIGIMVLNAVSIIMSETRGLYLAYLFGLVIYILVKFVTIKWGKEKIVFLNKKFLKSFVFLLIAFSTSFYFYNHSTISRFSQPDSNTEISSSIQGDSSSEVHDESLNVRVILLRDSIKIIKSSKIGLIFGNGYGTKIGKRTSGIEMSFLDILVEQGIIGVLVWLSFSLLPLYYYFRYFLIKKELGYIHVGLLTSIMAMLLITNINPVINSPIGLGYLLPVIIISYKLFESGSKRSKNNSVVVVKQGE